MATAASSSAQPTTWPLLALERFAISRTTVRVVVLAVVTSLAFGYRAVALSTYGFSEDEVNKVRAIEQYRHGHFGANAEHPMLMKLAAGLQAASPFYSLFRNGVGERVAAAGKTFPEEAYDYGVREAVEAIARTTGPPAFVVSDAPGVVAYYLKAAGRTDLQVRSLSGQGIPYGRQPSWVIVQDNHATFENHDVVAQLRRQSVPWREFRADDALTAEVFRISER